MQRPALHKSRALVVLLLGCGAKTIIDNAEKQSVCFAAARLAIDVGSNLPIL